VVQKLQNEDFDWRSCSRINLRHCDTYCGKRWKKMMIFKIIMGQAYDCCEGNTEVINADKRLPEQIDTKTAGHNPLVVSAVPVQEETKLDAEPPKV
jgi:hypothetical protein